VEVWRTRPGWGVCDARAEASAFRLEKMSSVAFRVQSRFARRRAARRPAGRSRLVSSKKSEGSTRGKGSDAMTTTCPSDKTVSKTVAAAERVLGRLEPCLLQRPFGCGSGHAPRRSPLLVVGSRVGAGQENTMSRSSSESRAPPAALLLLLLFLLL